ncbi:MAG: hypothetical protein ICV69_14575 [Thermoleophilaceae bacterium]|nr:hypothetical protein [Thermoleophilaceae bacterium]
MQAVLHALAETADREAIEGAREQLTAELRRLWAPESEGDTSQVLSSGPMDPDAPDVAGPERPVR